MKFPKLFTFVLVLSVFVACEKEADPIDFVDPNVIEESLGISNPEDQNPNIPTENNPIRIGDVNNVSFNAVSAQLVQETVDGETILTIILIDPRENQLTLTVPNPGTRTYAIDVPGTPSFDVEYIDAATGDAFITMRTANSTSSQGSLSLQYNANGQSTAIVSAQFVFTAFVETTDGTPPSRFIDFEEGNLIELPVTIIN